MSKSINLGNGSLLVGLDQYGQVKDMYFHYAGLENHIGHHQVHKIGIFVDDQFSWISSDVWEVVVKSEDDTMASLITATHKSLGISICFNDIVYNEENIFIRDIVIKNSFDRKRKVKIFFNQQFTISQTGNGDTAFYDPANNVMVHYKGRRIFLINVRSKDTGIATYSVGLLGIEGKEGTFKDAEDGNLSGNAVEHGSVDSVISMDISVAAHSEGQMYYWIVVAKSLEYAQKTNTLILIRGAGDIVKTTKDYWRAWGNIRDIDYNSAPKDLLPLFKKSLFYIRTHISTNGAIIASGDSDMLQFGRDTYSYIWPRDAAYISMALSKVGDLNATKRFFEFCDDIISDRGYFMHKYRPDKSLGSSWHPWITEKGEQIPIQEDETAIVLVALWKHFEVTRDLEFIESIYNSLIKKIAEFMVSYCDPKTGLPKASYDIWEMYYGVSTYTASTVYGALIAAGKFAKLLGKIEAQERYSKSAATIQKAILKYLYDEKTGVFLKYIGEKSDKLTDTTLDFSSVYGIFAFEVLPINDKRLGIAFEKYVTQLEVKTEVGGIARYEGDTYHHKGGNYPGNPWIITTMWLAEYYIEKAKSKEELSEAEKLLLWVSKNASPSGILPEQIDPYTGAHLSAAPLMWSHAAFVSAVVLYTQKLKELG